MLVCKRFHRAFETALYKWAWVAINCRVSGDQQTIVPYLEPSKLFRCANEFSNVKRLVRHLNVLRVALVGYDPTPEETAVTPEALRGFLSCTSPRYLHIGSSDSVFTLKDAWVSTLRLIEQALQADRLQTLEYRASGFPDKAPTVDRVARASYTLRTLHLPEPIPAGAYELPLFAHLTELRGVDLGSGYDCNSDFALAVAKQAPVLQSLYLNLYVSPPFDEHGPAAARNIGKVCGFVGKRLLRLEIQHAATVHIFDMSWQPTVLDYSGFAALRDLVLDCPMSSVDASLLPPNLRVLWVYQLGFYTPSDFVQQLAVYLADPQWQEHLERLSLGIPPEGMVADITEIAKLCKERGVDWHLCEMSAFSPAVWQHHEVDGGSDEEGVDEEGMSEAEESISGDLDGGASHSAPI